MKGVPLLTGESDFTTESSRGLFRLTSTGKLALANTDKRPVRGVCGNHLWPLAATGQPQCNIGGQCHSKTHTIALAGLSVTGPQTYASGSPVELLDSPNKSYVILDSLGSPSNIAATYGGPVFPAPGWGRIRLKWRVGGYHSHADFGCVWIQFSSETTFNTPNDSTSGIASYKWIAQVRLHCDQIVGDYGEVGGAPIHYNIFYGEHEFTADENGQYKWDGVTPLIFTPVTDPFANPYLPPPTVVNMATGGTLTITPIGTFVEDDCAHDLTSENSKQCVKRFTSTYTNGPGWSTPTPVAGVACMGLDDAFTPLDSWATPMGANCTLAYYKTLGTFCPNGTAVECDEPDSITPPDPPTGDPGCIGKLACDDDKCDFYVKRVCYNPIEADDPDGNNNGGAGGGRYDPNSVLEQTSVLTNQNCDAYADCLGRWYEATSGGSTACFVTHDFEAVFVQRVCKGDDAPADPGKPSKRPPTGTEGCPS